MTVEKLISAIPASLIQTCHIHNPKMVEDAAKGVVNMANSTGILAITESEAVEMFRNACENYRKKYNLL